MNQNLLTYYYRTFLYSAVPVVDFCPIRDVQLLYAVQYFLSRLYYLDGYLCPTMSPSLLT
jgi:hypothetical protein